MSGRLSNSPADVLAQALTDSGACTDPSAGGAWPIVVSNEPDSPDNVVTVYNTQGRIHGRTMADGEQTEHHGVMVRVRAKDEASGYAKARSLALALDGVRGQSVTVNGATYTVANVSRTGDVLPLGTNSPNTKRKIFTVNAVVALRQTN